ncbi:hypothetical protein Bbelb_357160 [Branchiostoma belcheri]|nr:hypothetical protein Bbelb_357160 [Branchiostoma belcheri]
MVVDRFCGTLVRFRLLQLQYVVRDEQSHNSVAPTTPRRTNISTQGGLLPMMHSALVQDELFGVKNIYSGQLRPRPPQDEVLYFAARSQPAVLTQITSNVNFEPVAAWLMGVPELNGIRTCGH